LLLFLRSAVVPPHPLPTLFPYTTLFRSLAGDTLHILVNNAGVIAPAMFADMTPEKFELVLGVHVGGAFTVSRAALPYLPDDGTGDRKSTRLNSSHVKISYAVFCLKKTNT